MNAKRIPQRFLTTGLCLATLALAACERPPIEATQTGYRGTAIVDVQNPRRAAPAGDYPAAQPPASDEGPRAGEVYQNVQVLGDLSVAQFTRLMTAITAWVSPEQGCNYCHYPDNLADDGPYTKVVSRRMIQMTRHINGEYASHVGNVGVNCYTCHRGKNVPEYIWFSAASDVGGMTTYAGNRAGQNEPAPSVGLASLPKEPFTEYFASNMAGDNIRVIPTSMLASAGGSTTKEAEKTYGLMMHFSLSLGVNCTYCHNSRSFSDWSNSAPQRWTAWHGIQMVRSANEQYLTPLQPVYPENRLGPALGDAPKAYCSTCHQGQKKPLGGADAVSAYPSLRPQ